MKHKIDGNAQSWLCSVVCLNWPWRFIGGHHSWLCGGNDHLRMVNNVEEERSLRLERGKEKLYFYNTQLAFSQSALGIGPRGSRTPGLINIIGTKTHRSVAQWTDFFISLIEFKSGLDWYFCLKNLIGANVLIRGGQRGPRRVSSVIKCWKLHLKPTEGREHTLLKLHTWPWWVYKGCKPGRILLPQSADVWLNMCVLQDQSTWRLLCLFW